MPVRVHTTHTRTHTQGYHLSCLDNGLTFIPEGDWLCPECTPEDEDHEEYDPEIR